MRYKADITAGALKLPESRIVADLLLPGPDAEGWKDARGHRDEERPRPAAPPRPSGSQS